MSISASCGTRRVRRAFATLGIRSRASGARQTSGRARSGGQDERPVRGRGRGVGQAEPFDDIYQVACYAVVKAVDRFDLGRGRAFTSYAVPTIVGEIKRHFRDRTWAVRVPRDLQELSLRVDRAVNELTRTLGRQPSVDEVADAIEVEPEDVVEAMEAASDRCSA